GPARSGRASAGCSRTGGDGALVALSSVVALTGAHADAIRGVMTEAWIADSYESAAAASRSTPLPVVTRAGDLFRGPHLVAGGSRDEARGILETKREIRE